MTTQKKPIQTFRRKGICISLWQANGKQYLKIDKTYLDKKSGEWKASDAYFPSELATLIDLLDEADQYVQSDELMEEAKLVETNDMETMFKLFKQFMEKQNGATNS